MTFEYPPSFQPNREKRPEARKTFSPRGVRSPFRKTRPVSQEHIPPQEYTAPKAYPPALPQPRP